MEDILSVLTSYAGIEAVCLGGSRALGVASFKSDYDVVIHRTDVQSFSLSDLLQALSTLGAAYKVSELANFVTVLKHGQKFEFFLKDLPAQQRALLQAQQGSYQILLKPLYPHGWLSTGVLSHLDNLDVLFDRSGKLKLLRDQAKIMPPALVKVMLKDFLQQMEIVYLHAVKINHPSNFRYLLGLVSQFIFFFEILVFVLNDKYPIQEKGGLSVLHSLDKLPQDYSRSLQVLISCGEVPDLKLIHQSMLDLYRATKVMADEKQALLMVDSTVAT